MKYYIETLEKEVEITLNEYENYIIERATNSGYSKKDAERVIRENIECAKVFGENVFHLDGGVELLIRE